MESSHQYRTSAFSKVAWSCCSGMIEPERPLSVHLDHVTPFTEMALSSISLSSKAVAGFYAPAMSAKQPIPVEKAPSLR
ncbi:hypothetical protein SCP_1402690 [Sparassis crispa]|uniref:Uncharacterized protein n=1 Tax=Sparassis crispa TaxID=139825 RepID=A0A401H370_9APHY|nr:hypothetical protein SCP_1402690 [Sparassis crispa]GBE88861.1 hypothetical protein SCP_1402690 [Sparassis crispa]